ncbi:MAG: hypothetical protein ACR5KV_04380 [Wolbachia sp.]
MVYTKEYFEEKLDREIETDSTTFSLDEGIGDQGAQALSEALKNDKYSSLESFSLTRSKLSDKGIKTLIRPFENSKYPNLTSFSLLNNKVGDKGSVAFFKLLESRKPSHPILLHLTIGCISKKNINLLNDSLILSSGVNKAPSYINVGLHNAGLAGVGLLLGFGLATYLGETAGAVITAFCVAAVIVTASLVACSTYNFCTES